MQHPEDLQNAQCARALVAADNSRGMLQDSCSACLHRCPRDTSTAPGAEKCIVNNLQAGTAGVQHSSGLALLHAASHYRFLECFEANGDQLEAILRLVSSLRALWCNQVHIEIYVCFQFDLRKYHCESCDAFTLNVGVISESHEQSQAAANSVAACVHHTLRQSMHTEAA